YTYYERQLGKKTEEVAIPELGELDKDKLDKMRFDMTEPEVGLREIEVDIAQDGKFSSYEAEELRQSAIARHIQDGVRATQLLAQSLWMIPDPKGHAHFWGIGGSVNLPGGEKLAAVAKLGADMVLAYADYLNFQASRAAKLGSYARREQDWKFQSNLAAGEITQIFKQLRAAQIREAIAEQELKNHRQHMKHAEEI